MKRLDAITYPSLSLQTLSIAESVLLVLLQSAEVSLIESIYAKALVKTKFDSKFADATKYFIKLGNFNKAEQIARAVKGPGLRAQALCDLAVALANIHHLDKAKELFDEAEQIIHSIEQLDARDHAIRYIATALANAQFFDEAEEIAHSIEQPRFRAQALCDVAVALFDVQRVDKAKELLGEAEEIARTINQSTPRSEALKSTVKGLVKAKLFNDALRIVKELQGADLIIALDEFAKAKRSEGLKQNLISLSYNTDFALRACAQMILFYDDQAEAIYNEVLKYK